MSEATRITIDPNVCGGRPCIRGLRVRVTEELRIRVAVRDFFMNSEYH